MRGLWPVIDEYQREPFVWGESDCCTFVGDCLDHLERFNPMFLLYYNGKREAVRVIRSFGSLSDAITFFFGEPIDPLYAREGDIVVCESDGEQISGIVMRTDSGMRCVLRTKTGLVDWRIDRAIKAWRSDGTGH